MNRLSYVLELPRESSSSRNHPPVIEIDLIILTFTFSWFNKSTKLEIHAVVISTSMKSSKLAITLSATLHCYHF